MTGPPAVAGDFETVVDLMDAAVEQIGDREAYVDGSRRLTFSDWMRAAEGCAGVLADRGVGRGDVVALHLNASIDYAILYAATARLGAVTTGINPRLGPDEVHGILARCDPRVLVIEDEAAQPAELGDVIVVRRSEVTEASDGGAGILRRSEPTHGGEAADDPVCIIWTSGTTGAPKGAWFDHRNLEAAVPAAGAMTSAFDRRISAVPMAHAGYMAKLWEQIAMGVTLVLSPTPWTAESMLETLVTERITVGAAVPTQWAKLLELPALAGADLSSLRIALAVTAPAAPELVERISSALGCPLVVRYAMTESPSITGTEPDDPPEVQARTVGRPQEGMDVIVAAEDTDCSAPPNAVGRICIRGGCVMRGYWNDPTRTAETLDADGTLTSTDLGRLDSDGNLVLVGRAGDMYIRGGYNVHPLEVEHVIADHPGVDQVAVVGTPADVIGEIGVAFVVPCDPAAPPALDELRNWVGRRLADYKAPDRLVVVKALPLTAMAKVDKRVLRESLGG
jgi:acyl-CoA synthetase (AMP-forming)/AMP-acid ligase II